MTLSEELQWRGFIQQTTVSDMSWFDGQPKAFYHGFDASADSQTIGNLAAMMCDLVFIRHGWQAYVLAGGATSLVGDPGGKDGERNIQSEETVAHNVDCAEWQLTKIYGDRPFKLVNNLDWTRSLSVIDFLRTVGKNVGIGDLIKKDFIASRLGPEGSGISYAEFSYTLLQGMDYLHLYDNYKVELQIGGSDQWGNCITGVELVRRMRAAEVQVLTLPLVIDQATGKKFGKSEDGAVWLDPSKTSPYKFYQFWLNVDDAAAIGYLKVYSELSKSEIDDIELRFRQNPHERLAQKTLAEHVTQLVHGRERCDSVVRVTEALFGGREFESLTDADIQELENELPKIKYGGDIYQSLVDSGLASSKSEARGFAKQGAIQLNGQKIQSVDDLELKLGIKLLKRGKNSFALLEV